MFNKKEIKMDADDEMQMIAATLVGGSSITLILFLATGVIVSTAGIILASLAAGLLLACTGYFIRNLFEELFNDELMDSSFSLLPN